MKKLLLIACCAVCVMACEQKPDTDTNNQGQTATALAPDNTTGKTLNGLDSAEAVKLVEAFKKDTTSKTNATSIWFSQAFVDDVYNIVSAQKDADGVRLYIGKKADGNNTLVVMSTKDVGEYKDPDSTKIPKSGRIHEDYFQHGIPLLDSPEVKNEDTYTVKLGDGADLYQSTAVKPCPGDNCGNINGAAVSCTYAKAWANAFKAGPINTRSVWYSIKLIWYLRKQMYASSAGGKRVDGIRIYFVKDTLRNKDGFLITPTEKLNGVHQDFYNCFYSFVPEKLSIVNHGEECPIFCKGTTM